MNVRELKPNAEPKTVRLEDLEQGDLFWWNSTDLIGDPDSLMVVTDEEGRAVELYSGTIYVLDTDEEVTLAEKGREFVVSN